MDVRISYGKIVSLDGNWSWAPREVISDVLGAVRWPTDAPRGQKVYLREDADHYVLDYLADRYRPLNPFRTRDNPETSGPDEEEADRWLLDAVDRIAQLTYLARGSAEIGALYPDLPGMRELRFGRDGTITVHSLDALIALSFTELLPKGPISFPQCDNCDFPFVPTGRGERFCSRPALNHKTPCRILAAMERHQARAPGFLNERKRIYEMVRRHPKEFNNFTGWKLENTRESWTKFEDWKATRKEGHDGTQ